MKLRKTRELIKIGTALAVLASILPAGATERKGAAEVQLLTPAIKTEALESKFPALVVKKLPIVPVSTRGSHFSPAERTQWIKGADLTHQTQNWDELDQDLLIMRAHRYDTEKLRSSYPNLPSSKLMVLQNLIQKRGGR
jgi:hypothetical protein